MYASSGESKLKKIKPVGQSNIFSALSCVWTPWWNMPNGTWSTMRWYTPVFCHDPLCDCHWHLEPYHCKRQTKPFTLFFFTFLLGEEEGGVRNSGNKFAVELKIYPAQAQRQKNKIIIHTCSKFIPFFIAMFCIWVHHLIITSAPVGGNRDKSLDWVSWLVKSHLWRIVTPGMSLMSTKK